MKKRLIPTFFLIAYSAILIKVMVFKDLPVIRIGSLRLNFGGTHEGPANLVPFRTILQYLLGEKGLIIAGINLVGNIVLLVPIGFLVPFIYRKMTWKKSLAPSVAAGFAIEGMQAVLRVGIFDIDDVLLNALGVMTGYWAFTVVAKWARLGKYKNIIIIAMIIFVTAMSVFYTAYPKGRQPVNSGVKAGGVSADSFNNEEHKILQNADPCNGTGGTGQIVSVGKNTITIRRHDGVNEIINLTNKTTIKNSVASLSLSDLKPGYPVTVVVMSNHIATTILVCNTPGPDQ